MPTLAACCDTHEIRAPRAGQSGQWLPSWRLLHCAAQPSRSYRGVRSNHGSTTRPDPPTAHSWLLDLRVFFSDLCAWATEPDSPFKRFAPRTIPVTRHTFTGFGFEKARERARARITATVLDLEREMPKIRAFALQRWKAAIAAPKVTATRVGENRIITPHGGSASCKPCGRKGRA